MKLAARVGAAGAGVGAAVALALPLVAAWEGLRTEPYLDLVGKPTVCYGETNAPMRRYTEAECRLMLERSLLKYAEPVLQCLPADAPVEVKAAFTSFAYNVGTRAACGSTAVKRANGLDYRGACDGLMAWVNAGGKRVQGLVNRRAAERALCLRGLS